jgi:hypothetical protein
MYICRVLVHVGMCVHEIVEIVESVCFDIGSEEFRRFQFS